MSRSFVLVGLLAFAFASAAPALEGGCARLVVATGNIPGTVLSASDAAKFLDDFRFPLPEISRRKARSLVASARSSDGQKRRLSESLAYAADHWRAVAKAGDGAPVGLALQWYGKEASDVAAALNGTAINPPREVDNPVVAIVGSIVFGAAYTAIYAFTGIVPVPFGQYQSPGLEPFFLTVILGGCALVAGGGIHDIATADNKFCEAPRGALWSAYTGVETLNAKQVSALRQEVEGRGELELPEGARSFFTRLYQTPKPQLLTQVVADTDDRSIPRLSVFFLAPGK